MPTTTDTDVEWFLVDESDQSVIYSSDDIIDCIHKREQTNTAARITDTDPR